MTHFTFNLLNDKVAVSDILTLSFLFPFLFPLWFVCLFRCFFCSFFPMPSLPSTPGFIFYTLVSDPIYSGFSCLNSKHLSHIFSTFHIIWLLRKHPSAVPSNQPCICCPLIHFATTPPPLQWPLSRPLRPVRGFCCRITLSLLRSEPCSPPITVTGEVTAKRGYVTSPSARTRCCC